MKNVFTISALIAAIFAGISFQASAVEEAKAAEVADASFTKLDADKNATLSREEVAGDKGLSASFDGLDTNFDGVLDAKEYSVSKSTEAKK